MKFGKGCQFGGLCTKYGTTMKAPTKTAPVCLRRDGCKGYRAAVLTLLAGIVY